MSVTARVPGPEHHLLLNPIGMMFEEVAASSLVKVDASGNKVLDTPFDINPAGFTIHSAVHMAREDAKCVMHLPKRLRLRPRCCSTAVSVRLPGQR